MASKSKAERFETKQLAHDAAIAKGLKENEFEVVSGPKGFSVRKKKTHKPVPNSKMHVGANPELTEKHIRYEVVPDHPNIHKEVSTGRYRWSDETEQLSQESFETIEAAETEAKKYGEWLNSPGTQTSRFSSNESNIANVPKTDPVDEIKDIPVEEIGPLTSLPPVGYSLSESIAQSLPKTEKKMCYECKTLQDTFISGDDLRYVEHPASDGGICNGSEEVVKSVPVASIPITEMKASEVATVQQASNPPVPTGTISKGIPLFNKSTIPNPTKTVWDIADRMKAANPNVRRRDVIKACIDAGIATFTARTQYQAWHTAHKSDPK